MPISNFPPEEARLAAWAGASLKVPSSAWLSAAQRVLFLVLSPKAKTPLLPLLRPLVLGGCCKQAGQGAEREQGTAPAAGAAGAAGMVGCTPLLFLGFVIKRET